MKSLHLKIAAFAFLLAGSSLPAEATVTTLAILDGGGTSRNTAWDQDGSSRYFALGGLYGIGGDNEADVFSDHGLGVHFLNALPAGSNAIGSITNTTFGIAGSLPAGTNAIGSITNTAFGITGALPAGSNTIGAISNTGFAITGNLPAFAATPAFNLYVNGSAITLGQQAKSGGIPVTLPSDVSSGITGTFSGSQTAGSYTAGYVIGGTITFTNVFGSANSGTIESINAVAKASAQTGIITLYLFNGALSGTYTDHAAPGSTFNTTDAGLLVGAYPLTNPNNGLGTMTVWNLDSINKTIKASGTNLYGVLVATSALTALASTTDISVTIAGIKD